MAIPPTRNPYSHRTEIRTPRASTRVRVTTPVSGSLTVSGPRVASHPGSPPDIFGQFSPLIQAAQAALDEASTAQSGSLAKLEHLMQQKTDLPALPVPSPSTGGGDFLGRLGANLASVMTGQGGFAADMAETIRREKEQREQTIQQNTMLQREQMMRERGEKLQFQYAQYGEAAERFREANKHALSLKMQQLQGKITTEMLDWEKKVGAHYDQELAALKGQFDIAQQWIARGFTYDLRTGQVGVSGAYSSMFAKQKQLWTHQEATKAILEQDTLFMDKRTKSNDPKVLRQGTMQKLEMIVRPRQGDDFEASVQRMMGDAPVVQFGYDGVPISKADRMFILGAAAIAYMDEVPGAREFYEEVYAPEIARIRAEQEKAAAGGGGGKPSLLTEKAKENIKKLLESLQPFIEEQGLGDINPFDEKRQNAFQRRK